MPLDVHATLTPPCPSLYFLLLPWQVVELFSGVDSQAAWHEAVLLRKCVHRRIVPLLGVALEVGASVTSVMASLLLGGRE